MHRKHTHACTINCRLPRQDVSLRVCVGSTFFFSLFLSLPFNLYDRDISIELLYTSSLLVVRCNSEYFRRFIVMKIIHTYIRGDEAFYMFEGVFILCTGAAPCVYFEYRCWLESRALTSRMQFHLNVDKSDISASRRYASSVFLCATMPGSYIQLLLPVQFHMVAFYFICLRSCCVNICK